ncbi:hypothetical protein CSAL01_01065 [Colletotrichum salicis]|uniref:Uncharacterized protein n=1 Tax=Colletotrichum salicis TaxID=1209931 RepID=A0A135T072_9PEZI|nr:hypothetical protein CSAL01_01065 [Colletotrichum salicis]
MDRYVAVYGVVSCLVASAPPLLAYLTAMQLPRCTLYYLRYDANASPANPPKHQAPLCTTCSRAGSSPDLMPSGDSNQYMALQHYARNKRHLSETEMDAERGRRKSRGQVLHLPLIRSPFSEEAPSSTLDAVTPARDTPPLPQRHRPAAAVPYTRFYKSLAVNDTTIKAAICKEERYLPTGLTNADTTRLRLHSILSEHQHQPGSATSRVCGAIPSSSHVSTRPVRPSQDIARRRNNPPQLKIQGKTERHTPT